MQRLSLLRPGALDDEQQALWDELIGGGRLPSGIPSTTEEGALIGPRNAYLHAPRLGASLAATGIGLRDGILLSPRHREIAILVGARHHRAQYEWYAHALIAEGIGIAREVIDAIHEKREPPFTDPADHAVHAFARELIEKHRVCDETYQRVADVLSERERVELVFVLGYYALVSMTLNVFEVPLPKGVEPPFPDRGPAGAPE